MLEPPPIDLPRLRAATAAAFGITVAELVFLPVGLDLDAAAYRVTTTDGGDFFLKLRRGVGEDGPARLARFLSDQGLDAVVAPLPARSGAPFAVVDDGMLLLYPFVEGESGWERPLSTTQWLELGRAIGRLHAVTLPTDLAARLPRETYSPRWRQRTRLLLEQAPTEPWPHPLAAATAAFVAEQRPLILAMVQDTERLAAQLHAAPPPLVLCHTDLHAGNLLLSGDSGLHIVDWDAPLLAPKERDLLFIGGALLGNHVTAEEEEARFYAGYGPTTLNRAALAYYRRERIIEDIVVFCDKLLAPHDGGPDREQDLSYLRLHFAPGKTVERALATTE